MVKNSLNPLFIILLLAVSVSSGVGQDIHFSQYYLSPLTLNPSNTGFFNGDYRGAANYRNQWRSIGNSSPFVTTSISLDINMKSFGLQPKQMKKGTLSGGLMFFSDKTGRAEMSNQSITLCASYRNFVDPALKHEVSVGFQGALVNRSMGYDLLWANQFDGYKIDPTLDPRENFTDQKISYVDIGIGAKWGYSATEKLGVNGGAAIFHITQPNESFLGLAENKLNSRISIHAGAEYKINNKIKLHPNVLYMNQTKAQEINFGSSVSYHMGEATEMDVILYGGIWNRLSLRNTNIDALFPTIGAKYKDVRVGISYDVNVSSLTKVSHLKGGPEIAIIYIGNIAKPMPVKPVLPCTRF